MIAVLYDWLLFFHILAAITWVGGTLTMQILATRIRAAGDNEQIYEMAGHFEFIGTRIFTPVSLVLLGLGIWMVAIGPWSFGMTWIDLAFLMFAYSFVSGAFYLGPTLKKARETADREGVDSEQVQVLLKRLFTVSRVELAFLILIVMDMVLKPFR